MKQNQATPDNRHWAPDTRHWAPDTRHWAPDTRHWAPDTRHPTHGLLPLAPESPAQTANDDKAGKAMKSKNYRIEWSTTSLGVARMKSQKCRLQAGFWPVAARKLKRIMPRPPS